MVFSSSYLQKSMTAREASGWTFSRQKQKNRGAAMPGSLRVEPGAKHPV
jgi:hypothetical protein